MKKLLFLMFPLAFFIGFMPYFSNLNETETVSTIPQNIQEDKEEEKNELCFENFEEQITNEVELLVLKNGIIENATVLTNDGIQNI